MSNIVGAFGSACPSSGSFNRSGINYEAGARTPLAAVFSAVLLVIVLLGVAPLAAYLPLAVMAGAAVRRRVGPDRRCGKCGASSGRARRRAGAGRDLSLDARAATRVRDLRRRAGVAARLPATDDAPAPDAGRAGAGRRRSVVSSPVATPWPQAPLNVRNLRCCASTGRFSSAPSSTCATNCTMPGWKPPERRDILLIGSGINFIDVAGAELLAHEAKLTREAGGTLYLCNLKPPVQDLLERGGFLDLYRPRLRVRHEGRRDPGNLRAARRRTVPKLRRRVSSQSAG